MALLPIHIILSVLFLQALRTSSTPEEAFLGYPLQQETDADENYNIYLDSRAEPAAYSPSAFKQSETRRRSTLDKNFARFGRSGAYNPMKTKLLQNLNDDPNMYNPPDEELMMMQQQQQRDAFGRNARSGEKSENFIRFGRGKSDFVRFGRADPRDTRNRDFIRFGRTARSVKTVDNNGDRSNQGNNNNGNHHDNKLTKKNKTNDMQIRRKKRSTSSLGSSLEFYKKAGSNFVRFGRADRNDNFMRFGRMLNDNYPSATNTNPLMQKLLPEINLNRAAFNTTSHINGNQVNQLLAELQAQQSHELLLRMLVDLLTRSHLQNDLQHPQADTEVHMKNNKCP